ncbi:multiubiquitin domain-containing protein [Streptomyces sp. NPDC008092]|uniref:multiubiquitin domain-containing protein n=1 Tax=Streptomyces sp. NPDC008092 TaxID=3364808 RepID=UPI0036E99179
MGSTVEQVDAQSPGKGHAVTITVNNKTVEITGPRVTGLQIKEAAIAQGVEIELDFQLSQELPSGETRIVGDTDVVTVNKNSVFTAVAGDDNS